MVYCVKAHTKEDWEFAKSVVGMAAENDNADFRKVVCMAADYLVR